MARPVKDPEVSSQSRSVALPTLVWAKVDSIVGAEFTGNRSAYFSKLVQRDLAARGLTERDEELFAFVQELAAACGSAAVREKLAELSALAATGTDPR